MPLGVGSRDRSHVCSVCPALLCSAPARVLGVSVWAHRPLWGPLSGIGASPELSCVKQGGPMHEAPSLHHRCPGAVSKAEQEPSAAGLVHMAAKNEENTHYVNCKPLVQRSIQEMQELEKDQSLQKYKKALLGHVLRPS